MDRTGRSGIGCAAAAGALATLLAASADVRAQSLAGIGLSQSPVAPSARVVAEDEWALLLLEALGLADVVDAGAGAEGAFALLCAPAAEMETDAEGRRVPASASFAAASEVDEAREAGEPVRAMLEVPAAGLYQLTVEGIGLQRWSIDGRALEHLDATPLGVAIAPVLVPLRQGRHELVGSMGRRARADRVELAAFRPLCIAPADGWRAGRPLSHGAAARSLARALGLERYLPEAGDAEHVEGEAYESASGWGGRTNEPVAGEPSGAGWARAGESAAEFAYRVRFDEPGLFSLQARVRGSAGQIWSVDGHTRIGVDGARRESRFEWVHVMTLPLVSGEHVIRALVPRGGGVDVIRLVRHRTASADYVDLLEQMGLRGGASDAAVTRHVALFNLTRPAFVELAADFRERMARGGSDEPLVVTDTASQPLYSRPLSPVLPAEL